MLFVPLILISLAAVNAGGGGPYEGDVRLVDGADSSEGRVEVYWNSQWNTVCDYFFNYYEALAVCRQLGFDGTALPIDGQFGQGTGDIVMRNLQCDGTESRLDDCSFLRSEGGRWDHVYCSHNYDAGVRCGLDGTVEFDTYDIRLVDGSSPYEGRVEVFHGGVWGSVCDDFFDEQDAAVACRDAGFWGPAGDVNRAGFGQSSGPILMDNLFCSGFELGLNECDFPGWTNHNCQHSEDSGVRCTPGDIRLTDNGVDTTSTMQGNVEVKGWDGAWKSVCKKGWGQEDAQVLCNELGFTGPAQAVRGGFASDNTDYYFTQVRCNGNEPSILQCFSDYKVDNCSEGMHAGVICSGGVSK